MFVSASCVSITFIFQLHNVSRLIWLKAPTNYHFQFRRIQFDKITVMNINKLLLIQYYYRCFLFVCLSVCPFVCLFVCLFVLSSVQDSETLFSRRSFEISCVHPYTGSFPHRSPAVRYPTNTCHTVTG